VSLCIIKARCREGKNGGESGDQSHKNSENSKNSAAGKPYVFLKRK
jgi:hypothetical protein